MKTLKNYSNLRSRMATMQCPLTADMKNNGKEEELLSLDSDDKEENCISHIPQKILSQSYTEASEVCDGKDANNQQKSSFVLETDLKAQELGVRIRDDKSTHNANGVNETVEIRNIQKESVSPEECDDFKIFKGADDSGAVILEPVVTAREESNPVNITMTGLNLKTVCIWLFGGVILSLSLARLSMGYTRLSTRYNISSGSDMHVDCDGPLVSDLNGECRGDNRCSGTLGAFSTSRTGSCRVQRPTAGGLSEFWVRLMITDHYLVLDHLGSGTMAVWKKQIEELSVDGPRDLVNIILSPKQSALQIEKLLNKVTVVSHNLPINVQYNNPANESYSCSYPDGRQRAKRVCDPLSRLDDREGYHVEVIEAADLINNIGKYIFNGQSSTGRYNDQLSALKVESNESSFCFSIVDQAEMLVWQSCSNKDTFVNNLSNANGSSCVTIHNNGEITINTTDFPLIMVYAIEKNSGKLYVVAEFKYPITSIKNSHNDKKGISTGSVIVIIVVIFGILAIVIGVIVRRMGLCETCVMAIMNRMSRLVGRGNCYRVSPQNPSNA